MSEPPPACIIYVVPLVLLSLALLVSLCLNIILCIRQRATLCRDESCYPENPQGVTLTQNEGQYFHYLNRDEQQENPHDHHEQQENPIYGNISTDSRGSVEGCYEMMTMQRTRDCEKPLEPDLNYASLDLKIAKKHKKKHRHQQSQTQGRNKLHEQLSVAFTTPVPTFLEVDADVDALLPSRDTSTMVSHSSIYLNSQQIAQEAGEMERGRSTNMERENVGWDSMRRYEDRGSREWKGDQESGERIVQQDGSNGNVCPQLSEGEIINCDSGQHD
ncbi:uncharacterized protein LOC103354482 [Stegastes partitus]|uniref:Uncharacterized protein LOC103354482 n=1 Tax=Stegastes partitus TaxID=144197 RepID=A0A9Y4JHV9_9TELE|nr:PREDICTED: uncharacterized protein LOC103354482 [Stegastes partitus]